MLPATVDAPGPQIAPYSMVLGMDKHLARMTGSSAGSSRYLQATPPRTRDTLHERLAIRQRELSYLSVGDHTSPRPRGTPRSHGNFALPQLQSGVATPRSRTYDRPATVGSPRTARAFVDAVRGDGQGAAAATSTHDVNKLIQARSSMGASMYAASFRGTQNDRYDRSIRPYAANGARSEILATSSHSLCSGSGKFGYF